MPLARTLLKTLEFESIRFTFFFFFSKEESLSICSTTTLTQDEALTKSDSPDKSEENEHTPNSSESISNLKRSSTDESDKDKSDEKDAMCKQIDVRTVLTRRPSNISNSALTNVSLLTKIHSTSDPVKYFFN